MPPTIWREKALVIAIFEIAFSWYFFSYTKIIIHKLILSIAVFHFEHVVNKCSPLSIFLKKWRLEISYRGPIGNLIAKSFWNYLPHAQFRLLLLQNLSLESIFSKKKIDLFDLKNFSNFPFIYTMAGGAFLFNYVAFHLTLF